MRLLISSLAVAVCLSGCIGHTSEQIESALMDKGHSAELAKCRAEARTAYYEQHKTVAEAMQAHDDCVKRISK